MGSYELMAARVENVFQAHKLLVRVWQAVVTPRFVRFDVTTTLGTRLSAIERLADELAMALNVSAVRVYRAGGIIRVEVPRESGRQVDLPKLLSKITSVPPLSAILGIDSDGTPLLLRLDSPDVAHVLVAGTTGSGKTALLRTFLLSLAMYNHLGQFQLVLIDPKGRGLEPLTDLPHLWAALAQDHADAALLLTCLTAEMERRDRMRIRVPHLVVAIDELADLVQSGGEKVTSNLTRLTQRGREAGIHVVAATQRPAAALIGGMMKANFPIRLVGSVTSPEDARVASGLAGTGAERLLGRGDFLLVAKGQVVRFQAAYVGDAELRRLVNLVAEGGRRTRHWTATQLTAEPQAAGGRRLIRHVSEVAQTLGVGWVGIDVLDVPATARVLPFPAPPHPTPLKRSLRERYSADQLRQFIADAGGNLSEAARLAFGYKDSVTLAIMREAQQTGGNNEYRGTTGLPGADVASGAGGVGTADMGAGDVATLRG